MDKLTLKPSVDAAQEFIEIATDFSNPLDLVREAISNSFDANAKTIRIAFSTSKDAGESILVTEIEDDGSGMDLTGLQSFFDLGNSLRRGDAAMIGEKGHGTKVYFNSSEIEVITVRDGARLRAVMDRPFRTLHQREIPTVEVTREDVGQQPSGTLIRVRGYNNNRRDRFQHDLLKDYVQWFTKFGSCEGEFGHKQKGGVKLLLKGLDVDQPEEIHFGHVFPPNSAPVSDLFDQHLVDAPEHYAKKIIKQGQLRNFPEIKYQAVFCIEGNKVKLSYNPMLKRQGYTRGHYKVQDRYGLWLCKDFIPVQRANHWFGSRGTEYIRFHAFLNCQGFRLTANRGSVNNTASEVLDDLRREVQEIYTQITASQDWRDIEWLDTEASGYYSTEREKRDFQNRKKKFNTSQIAKFKDQTLAAPQHESAVFGLVMKLTTLDPACFPFEILDYNTYQGYDLLVKGDHSTPIHQSHLFYVELKYILTARLNHSFENLKAIVAWDTGIKHGGTVTELNDETRTLHVAPPESSGDVTRFFLDHSKKGFKIEVYVLKEYLREKYGLEFRTRNSNETV